jgi:hypothetical protein
MPIRTQPSFLSSYATFLDASRNSPGSVRSFPAGVRPFPTSFMSTSRTLLSIAIAAIGAATPLAAQFAAPQQAPATAFLPGVVEQPRFEVIGRRERLPVIGGSADTFGEVALEQSRVFTVN